MALPVKYSLPSFLSIICPHYSDYNHASLLNLFPHPRPKSRRKFSLSAVSPSDSNTSTSLSSSSIFLPFLQEEEENQKPGPEEVKLVEAEEDLDSIKDPIVQFFKSRSSSMEADPDPGTEGKLSLRSNRRSSWHLAPNTKKVKAQPDAKIEIEVEKEEVEKEELVSDNISSDPSIEGVVGEILQIAWNLPENMTLGELMVTYKGRVSEKQCVEILGLMGQEGLIMGCLYFFEWMGLQDPSLITGRACSVLFPLMGKSGMGDKLMVLVSNLPDRKQFRDVHVYNSALSGLLCCERYDDAWEVYEIMGKHKVQPDHVTCSIMITIMRKNGNTAKEALDFFQKANKKGDKWSLEVTGALTKSFCDEGLKKEALIIQLEMERRGISSNAIIYNTLMDAYAKSDQVEEAEGLFAEMKAKGIEPTSATYNILMDAYSRRMQPEIIEKLLVEMEERSLLPNVKSYTCLISAYGRQKNMSDMAANAFLRMKKLGIKPSSHSYTALIHGYSVSGWHEKAYITFENMQREGIKPAIETYTALLDAFRRAGDTEMLMNIWKMMIKDKIDGTRVTFNILLDGFAKQGHYVEARDVVGEFGKLGFEPTVMTYNMLINAFARGGQESKLPQLLKEMAVLNLKPDSITYSTMIYAYIRVRDFKRAFYYHKQMVKSGQVPDAKNYKKLRSILDVKAAVKNSKDKSAILGIINSKMGMVKEKRKGKKDEFWKNRKTGSKPYGSDRVGY